MFVRTRTALALTCARTDTQKQVFVYLDLRSFVCGLCELFKKQIHSKGIQGKESVCCGCNAVP